MKKLFLLPAFVGFAFLANAQSPTYKPFKVDLNFGYAIPSSGSGTKAGVSFAVEPHYRITDAISLGLRLEAAGLGNVDETDGDTHAKISLLTSYCPTAEYYFSENKFRPFAGVGAGLFTQKATVAATGEDAVSSTATRFGFFPRAGFEFGHLRMSAAYNVLGSGDNYTNLTIGFFLGGGKK